MNLPDHDIRTLWVRRPRWAKSTMQTFFIESGELHEFVAVAVESDVSTVRFQRYPISGGSNDRVLGVVSITSYKSDVDQRGGIDASMLMSMEEAIVVSRRLRDHGIEVALDSDELDRAINARAHQLSEPGR